MLLRIVGLIALIMLAGCNTAGSILTGNVTNPLTPRNAIILHTAFTVGVEIPAGIYASQPRCSTVVTQPCSKQAIVNGLRRYINPANTTLRKLDKWALGNTTLNGPALYQAATIAITQAKDFALASGISGVK